MKQEQTCNNQEQLNKNKHVTVKNNNLVDFVYSESLWGLATTWLVLATSETKDIIGP